MTISCPAQHSDGEKEPRPSEVVRRPFAGVRAVRSAHAALCTSPFGAATVRELATAPIVKNAGGKREEEILNGVEIQVENKGCSPDEPPLDIDDLRKRPESAGVAGDALPYLSIGLKQGDADEQAADRQSQRATAGKLLRRISTWPPDAVEWQARRKRVPPPGVAIELEKPQSCLRPVEMKDGVTQGEGEGKVGDVQPVVRPTDEGASVCDTLADVIEQKGETRGKHASAGQIHSETTNAAVRGSPRAARVEKSARKTGATTAEQRGVTPNDETLLSGNEYVFVDLLHEVVHNKGRWTRERWRQTHTCKPWRKERGADTHLK